MHDLPRSASVELTSRARVRSTRPGAWRRLASFSFLVGVTQLLWLNFAPLLSLVQARYGVSEGAATSLISVFPLFYVVLSLHAGALIDRVGYRKVVAWGATATALFATVRIYDVSFWALLAGQAGIAAAQPYVTNGISKLVGEWFGDAHGAIATGVGTMGLFVGMAVALAWTPVLVAQSSLRTAMVVFAALAALAALLFRLAHFRQDALHAPEAAPARRTLRELVRQRDLRLVFALAFLGLGFFNGFTTLLEPILAPSGITAEQAGLVGAVMIIGGIAGSLVIPGLSDKLRRRKPVVLGCTAVAAGVLWPLCSAKQVPMSMLLAAVLGFFFLPAYALLLEMCSELAGRASAGYATGVLMLAGNAGGVVVITAMQLLRGDAPTYESAIWLLLGLLLLALVLASLVRETFAR